MNRQWLYTNPPRGKLTPDTFQWHESAIPEPRAGEALVRTRMLSLDPANRALLETALGHLSRLRESYRLDRLSF